MTSTWTTWSPRCAGCSPNRSVPERDGGVVDFLQEKLGSWPEETGASRRSRTLTVRLALRVRARVCAARPCSRLVHGQRRYNWSAPASRRAGSTWSAVSCRCDSRHARRRLRRRLCPGRPGLGFRDCLGTCLWPRLINMSVYSDRFHARNREENPDGAHHDDRRRRVWRCLARSSTWGARALALERVARPR